MQPIMPTFFLKKKKLSTLPFPTWWLPQRKASALNVYYNTKQFRTSHENSTPIRTKYLTTI